MTCRRLCYACDMCPVLPSAAHADDSLWRLDLGGIAIEGTDDPHSSLLGLFYSGYDRAFVLADEREDIAGFRRCLALNATDSRRFGRTHRELVIVAWEDGVLLGGANFLATRMAPVPDHPAVAVALNYVFVEEAQRGRGLARLLLDAVSRLANRAVGMAENEQTALFIEQNDPLLLSAADYAADNSHAGIDQVDRLAVWARLGARLVDFPYVQPALSPDQDSDDGLAYAAVGFPLPAVNAGYLHDHLESFFGISVLKGGDPATHSVAGPQLARLEELTEIPLLSMDATLMSLREGDAPRGTPLRVLARSGI